MPDTATSTWSGPSDGPAPVCRWTRKRAQERGGEMVFAAPSRFVKEVLDTLGLQKVLTLFENEREAVVHLKERG